MQLFCFDEFYLWESKRYFPFLVQSIGYQNTLKTFPKNAKCSFNVIDMQTFQCSNIPNIINPNECTCNAKFTFCLLLLIQ